MLPPWRGKEAVVAARVSLGWMFSTTPCMKVITHVPVYNRAADALAKRAGMVHEGTNRASFLRDGTIYDQDVYGVTAAEFFNSQGVTCQ
ncbi:MAG: GNAT family N-acetyltransferase [Gammaproteobacteria bacterium]